MGKNISFTNAHIWDGIIHLPGQLELTPQYLTFNFDNFQTSQLHLRITIAEITKVKLVKIYTSGKIKGLQIKDSSGRTFTFLVEDPQMLKGALSNFQNH